MTTDESISKMAVQNNSFVIPKEVELCYQSFLLC